MTDLIIAIDDKLDDDEARGLTSREISNRLSDLLETACDDFAGLRVPVSGRPVQLKLNTVARNGGQRYFEMVEAAKLGLFLDWKLPQEVLDTLFADIRAVAKFSCIQRITFRVENQIEFLAGRDDVVGACAMMPHTSFLPVGPVTDLSDRYYSERMSLTGGRPEAMKRFGDDVLCFGDHVTEVICSPKDIAYFDTGFWTNHKPVTPAVRPASLKGNTANDVNAFNVEKAIRAGSKGLVIGSPIMSAPNPRKAAELVIKQMGEAQAS